LVHTVSATPQPATDPATPVTLARAAETYLATITGMASADSRKHDLAAWTCVLGAVPVDQLTPVALLTVWNGWTRTTAISTRQHRRTALLACLKLTAPTVEPMARAAIPWPAPARALPRELPYPTIAAILAAMPSSRAQTMLSVMAETGLPPQTVRRLTADDVNLQARTVRLPARDKGAGAHAVVLPLTAGAVAAFRAYGWQPVSKASLWTVWSRAVRAVRAAGIPCAPCSPYILRHSFAGRVLDATNGDLQALRELLQHMDLETSLQYVRARASRSVRAAVDAMDAGGLDRWIGSDGQTPPNPGQGGATKRHTV
jgi:integrase